MGLWLKQDGELVPVSGGSTGADGADGADGNMWHVGSGDPDPTLGEDGDYYLDGDAGWVWIKRSSGWTNLYVNLTGPPGADGDGGGSHDHDSDYYQKDEVDLAFAPIVHNHDGAYSAITHDHAGVYATAGHNHDGAYSAITHDHAGVYLPLTGGTVTGKVTIAQDNEALALAATRPYVALYRDGVRAGYFGYPSAASGGVTSLSADGNALHLFSAGNIKVNQKIVSTSGDLTHSTLELNPHVRIYDVTSAFAPGVLHGCDTGYTGAKAITLKVTTIGGTAGYVNFWAEGGTEPTAVSHHNLTGTSPSIDQTLVRCRVATSGVFWWKSTLGAPSRYIFDLIAVHY